MGKEIGITQKQKLVQHSILPYGRKLHGFFDGYVRKAVSIYLVTFASFVE